MPTGNVKLPRGPIRLTRSEERYEQMALAGMTSQQIAEQLGRKLTTVRTALVNVRHKREDMEHLKTLLAPLQPVNKLTL